MDNPYSGELPKINKIAEDVHIIFDKISELELQASNIQSQISQVPYQTDEDGYDVNEGQRNALYGQLYSVNSLIEEANEARNQLQLEAYALVSDYQSKIAIYEEKARKTAETKSSFDKLSGYRFGARTATASSQFAEQRKMHYDDQVSILRSLSEAAQNAANGIQTATTIQTISERGEFNDPNKIFSGNHLENDKDVNEQINDLEDDNWNGKPGESIKNINDNIAASILKNLEMDGIPYHAGKPDFSNVSHALVNTNIPDVGIVAAADAVLAKKYGVSKDDIVSYRQENGLEWRDDGSGNNANLIPQNISRAFEEGREENREPTAMEALSAYMYAHNYGEKDAAIYMKDPEWNKLHRAAFPEYYNKIYAEKEYERQNIIRRELYQRKIPYKDFCGYTLVNGPRSEENYVVVGGSADSYKKYMDFEKQGYTDYVYEECNHIQFIDSRLVEGIDISSYDLENPNGFWGMHANSLEKWTELSNKIPLVQLEIEKGRSLDEILQDKQLGDCATTYFDKNHSKPISVYEVDGIYVFAGDGRHRLLTAQKMGAHVPVKIVRKYIKNKMEEKYGN